MRPRYSSLSLIISRYYWLQVMLIGLAVMLGVLASGYIMRELLIREALKQEVEHYWELYEENKNTPLPNTKNLFGYRWQAEGHPIELEDNLYELGIYEHHIEGDSYITMYSEKDDQKLLLAFGHSNVDRLVWLYGIAPLILALFILYSVLWFIKLKTHRKISPISQLTERIREINLKADKLVEEPFKDINPQSNIEAMELTNALNNYHDSLTKYIHREQQFTSEVSHELRTPLSVIKGSVQILQHKYQEEDKTLVRIDNNIKDMEVIIETLFLIARQRSDWLETANVSLNKVILKLQQELKELSFHKQIEIKVNEYHSNLAHINETLAYIVFSNLLRNALLYSNGTEVIVDIFNNKIIIEDNGQGIIENDKQKYDQRNKLHTGLGIGLSLVRRICAQINWEMHLENNIGEGVRVILLTEM